MPRDPQWAYAYWDTPSSHKEELRSQGGEWLALRLYDVTDVDLSRQSPHGMQQFSLRRTGAGMVPANSCERSRLHGRNWLPDPR